MEIAYVNFLLSAPTHTQLPAPDRPEYAFAGRSNVGKSSLLNALTGQKVAKTSGTPGKTQHINLFEVDNTWYLADLPGYGYAKVSQSQRRKFEKMIKDYLNLRPNLLTTFVLLDSRHAPMEIDLEFIQFLGMSGLPLALVFTKLDKLGKTTANHNVEAYKEKLLETWEELPPIFLTSSKDKAGMEEIRDYIGETNKVIMQ